MSKKSQTDDAVKRFEKTFKEKGPVIAAEEAVEAAYFRERMIGDPEEIEIEKDSANTQPIKRQWIT